MVYREPGFLAVLFSKLSLCLFLSLPLCRRASLLKGDGDGGWAGWGKGAKADDGEKAWSSINHPILNTL